MMIRGDTERQAILRNGLTKKTERLENDPFIIKLRSIIKSGKVLLDIGCGTAHIIHRLAMEHRCVFFVGLDISSAMLTIARQKTRGLPHIQLVEGDGLMPPFADCSFDTVMVRLAEYSSAEAHRILKTKGYFLEYGLGPEADKEIVEFFQERINHGNFFFPHDPENWQEEVCTDITAAGFDIESINEYRENDYYQNKEDLMDLIEMVPLVQNFDRIKDSKTIDGLAAKYSAQAGITITWHYYILCARRS